MQDKKEPGLIRVYWENTLALLSVWGFPLFFVWTFLFAGIATLGFGIISSMEAFYSRSWPNVEGIITLSQIDTYLSESNTESDTGNIIKTTTMYHPQVSYNFQVNGQEYHGDVINLDDISTSDVQAAEKIIARYPKGKVVRIFYDPGRPEKAVLEPGLTAGLLIPLTIGTLVTILAIVMIIFLFRKIFGQHKRKASNA
jgi:hypothetical protein